MAFIRRQVVKQVTNANGSVSNRVIVVVGDDSVTNQVDKVEVSLSPIGEAPAPSSNNMILPLKVVKANGNKRFVNAELTFSTSALGANYTMTSVMKDSSNKQVGEAVSGPTTVVDNKESRIRNIVIRQVNSNNFLLKVVVVDPTNTVTSVDVIFVDYTGPAPIPTEVNLTNPTINDGKKIFKMNTLTFEDPAAAVAELYNMVVDLKSSDAKSLGYSEEGIYVEGLENA